MTAAGPDHEKGVAMSSDNGVSRMNEEAHGGDPDTPTRFAAGLQIATILVDDRRHIFHFDKWAEHLTGFSAGTIIGRDYYVLFGTDVDFTDQQADGTDGADESMVMRTMPLRRADGSIRPALVQTRPVSLPDGTDILVMQAVDVDRSRELRTQLSMLDGFFHQSPVGQVILDEHLRYVMVNDALAEYNGFEPSELIGRHMSIAVGSSDFEEYKKMLLGVLRTGEPVIDVKVTGFSRRKPGASKVWSATWFRIKGLKNREMALCGIIYDVTASRIDFLSEARTRQQLNLLGLVGELQSQAWDPKRSATELVEMLTREYCDLAAIDVSEEYAVGVDAGRRRRESRLRTLGASTVLDDVHAQRLVETPDLDTVPGSPLLDHIMKTHTPRLVTKASDVDDIDIPGWVWEAVGAIDANSYMGVPLIARGFTIGVLSCMRTGTSLRFNEDDLEFLQTVASRTALMLDNARLYREAKETALLLQMNILPSELPDSEEFELVHRYIPGHKGHRVSGDWYDVSIQPGHSVALAVGDVVGHGIAAAATMGRYRSALQALTTVGLEPAALMTRLNEIAETFGEANMATCLYVSYDPWRHRCSVVSAGHPPLIVIPPEGAARLVEERNGPLLGGFTDARYTNTRLDTPPGTRLLLYSDGLVESPTVTLDEGIANLMSAVDRTGGELNDLADAAMAVAPVDSHDDSTILICELRGLHRG
ncbi:SpoIIE family protein phosphatase [Salininema proteolyticum]|uniref:SpoIIE family protein phosphatase n=1 Tax=Salininema proteolyticum TaxID=1607685 RepID=A0ABV8TXN8_9ACTN